MLPAEREQLSGIREVDQAGEPTGFRSRVNNSFTTCFDLLAGCWKLRQILDEHQAPARHL
jgi:hypothetical protein